MAPSFSNTYENQYTLNPSNPDVGAPSSFTLNDSFTFIGGDLSLGANVVTVTFLNNPTPSGQISVSGHSGSVGVSSDFYYVGGIAGSNGIVVYDASSSNYYLLTNTVYVGAGAQPKPTQYDSSEPLEVVCLLEDTLIPTSLGSKLVQDLNPGDEILCIHGDFAKLRWVGVQTISPFFTGKASWPVKISKGALVENSPSQDLYVSQDHAIFFEGLLICAEALVNGTTITLEKPTESTIKYYALDLGPATIHPVHNLLVGSLGGITREYFDNYQEWLDSGHELIDEPLMVPRVRSSNQLPNQVRVKVSA